MSEMKPASADLAALVAVVNLKHLPNTLNDLARSQGVAQPKISEQTMLQVANARRLWKRFNRLDFRADAMERGLLRSLCDWLSGVAAQLSGQQQATMPQWQDDKLVWKPSGSDVTPPTDYPEAKRREDWNGVVEAVALGKIG